MCWCRRCLGLFNVWREGCDVLVQIVGDVTNDRTWKQVVWFRLGSKGDEALQFWQQQKKCVFHKRTIKVCATYSWQCLGLGPLRWPWAAYLTMSLFLYGFGVKGRGKLQAFEGLCVGTKSLSRIRDGYTVVTGGNGRGKYFPDKGTGLLILLFIIH